MTLLTLANAVGWTLLHSIWEGAAIALILAAALSAMHSSRLRYGAACAALALMFAAFLFTAARQAPEPVAPPLPGMHSGTAAPGGQSLSAFAVHFRTAGWPPYVAAFWLAGVVLFQLRSVAGWAGARRLRRRGVCVAPAPWHARLAELGSSVGLRNTIPLLESCLAGVPVVAGYLRPVILVPVGMLTSMPAGHVEAILLHELAHILRRDYLVNLLQTVVENFLFYHPAVWWISGTVRTEREHCCDDLMLATRGNAGEYALALTALETNRWTANKAVLASDGGNL